MQHDDILKKIILYLVRGGGGGGGLVDSDKKSFSCFPYISLCKTCNPQGGAIFDPRGIF